MGSLKKKFFLLVQKICKIGMFGAHAYAGEIKPAKEVTSHVKSMEMARTLKLPNAAPGCFFTVLFCFPMITQSQSICLVGEGRLR